MRWEESVRSLVTNRDIFLSGYIHIFVTCFICVSKFVFLDFNYAGTSVLTHLSPGPKSIHELNFFHVHIETSHNNWNY